MGKDEDLGPAGLVCFCTNRELRPDRDLRFRCSSCDAVFSAESVDFIKEHLFNCPSCLQNFSPPSDGDDEDEDVEMTLDKNELPL